MASLQSQLCILSSHLKLPLSLCNASVGFMNVDDARRRLLMYLIVSDSYVRSARSSTNYICAYLSTVRFQNWLRKDSNDDPYKARSIVYSLSLSSCVSVASVDGNVARIYVYKEDRIASVMINERYFELNRGDSWTERKIEWGEKKR